MKNRTSQGFTLIEILVALAVSGLLLALAAPALLNASGRLTVRLAAYETSQVLSATRVAAIRESAYVAARFRVDSDGQVWWALFRDGDGDGVITRDIRAGIDRQISPERILSQLLGSVRPGFPPGPGPRDPGDPKRRLDRLDDPIRFNDSNLASFDPFGGATPGSIYFSDGKRWVSTVRVTGRSGRIRVLVYDPAKETWR